MPLLFVDGHAKMHDFSRTLPANPGYPHEPAGDWIWYKPADDQTNSTQSLFPTPRTSDIPSPALSRR